MDRSVRVVAYLLALLSFGGLLVASLNDRLYARFLEPGDRRAFDQSRWLYDRLRIGRRSVRTSNWPAFRRQNRIFWAAMASAAVIVLTVGPFVDR